MREATQTRGFCRTTTERLEVAIKSVGCQDEVHMQIKMKKQSCCLSETLRVREKTGTGTRTIAADRNWFAATGWVGMN